MAAWGHLHCWYPALPGALLFLQEDNCIDSKKEDSLWRARNSQNPTPSEKHRFEAWVSLFCWDPNISGGCCHQTGMNYCCPPRHTVNVHRQDSWKDLENLFPSAPCSWSQAPAEINIIMENIFCAYFCGQQLLLDQAITGHVVEPTGSLTSSSWLVLCCHEHSISEAGSNTCDLRAVTYITPWNGNLLQYSCLENAMERGAWWATVHNHKELDMSEWLSTHAHKHISLSPHM